VPDETPAGGEQYSVALFQSMFQTCGHPVVNERSFIIKAQRFRQA